MYCIFKKSGGMVKNTESKSDLNSLNNDRGKKAEDYLNSLLKDKFFSPWVIPNPYKQRGYELSDSLVVFNNNILIFSAKDNSEMCENLVKEKSSNIE
jgi:hypothetical protein